MPQKRKKPALTERGEKNRAKIQKQNKRKDSEYRDEELSRDNSSRRARRSDPEYLTTENSRNLSSLRARRSNPEYQQNELQRNNSSRRARRSDPEYLTTENSRNLSSLRARRSDPEYQQEELERNNSSRRARRSDPEYLTTENSRDLRSLRARRSDPEYQQEELERNNSSRRARRSDPEYLTTENSRDLRSLRARRSDPEYQQEELERNNSSRRARRSDPEYLTTENSRNLSSLRARRSDPEYQQEELERNNSSRRARRSDPEYLTTENSRDLRSLRARRSDPEYQQEELERNNSSRRARRSNPEYQQNELQRNNSSRRARRSDPEYQQNEIERDNSSRGARREIPTSWNSAVATYEKNIRDGPCHRCYSCDKLIFSTQINMKTNINDMIEKGYPEPYLRALILEELYDSEEYIFCSTCNGYIRSKKFPRFNINNSNLKFPVIPPEFKELNLQGLEERCVAARIPFMKLRALGCDRQLGIKSGVVNVPIDVRKTIESIPARPDDCGVIELSLKRKTAYKSHYMKERVRPGAIWKAAQLLCNTELYKQEGITLNHTYESQDMNLQLPESSENIESNIETSIVPNSELRQTDTEAVPSNNDEENYIQEETLLDSNEGINFAPGEGQIPIPMFLDKYCEELAFPTIFFGTARKSQPTGVRLSYEDIVKSELQRYDRRACRADHLLFVHKKSQIKQLMGQMNIVFRKTSREANITAAQVANKDYIDNSISQDHAYKFMASITGTPAYWEQQKKKVLGMVRQYGIFTLFITLTAAETHWKELLVILKKTVDMEDITEEAAGDLSFEEKARLIRTDPVTCAQYFDHRFKEVRKTWINVENGPFGKYKIIHYFYRIEFQHRGSPHVHMVIWIENAPIFVPYDVESEAIVAEFTDLVSTTDSDDPLIQDFIKYQMHKCSQTCKKMSRGNAGCRFGAPFRPMDKTRILYPFDDDKPSKEMTKKIRDLNKKIQDMLNDKPEEIGTFEEMLHKLDCTLDLYLLATRANLKHPTIFIKREPKNTRVNVYNKLILPLMRSNMDIQFVLDPYSCIAYIVDYVNKSSRGLSKLLRECVEETKRGNKSLKETLKSLAHILYNSSEISAQEAAWCRLRLPMCKCSDLVEFINTSHSLKRTHMLKSAKEINRLAQIDPTNTDIFKKGSIEHYANRPNELEELCLAEFVANYTFNCKAGTTTHEDENIEVDAEVEPIEDNSVQTNQKKLRHFLLKDNSGTIKERKTPKVIRYCRFSIETDEENFMREMCLLFLPWRNEKQDIEDNDCANLYLQNRQIISENYSKFNAIDLDINDIVRDIEEERRLQEQAQDANDPENLNPEENADFFNIYEFDDNVVRPDLMNEIGEVSLQERTSKYIVPNIYSDEEYLKLCDSLNSEQRDYLMHVISCFKDGNELPIYHFISGGAGVGKTCLVRALFQSLMRVFRSLPGTAKKNEIVLAASTGMAAHNIGGITTHQAFHLTISRGNSSSLLSPDIANTMAADLHDLKLIIIDEISMLSSELFYQISSRLKQIFRTNQEFGGKSVIVVGDFNQLRPVGGTRTFLPKDSNSANSTSILTENLQWNLFKLYKLTKVMRQRDDLKFAEALNRIPSGETTAEDIQMFDSRSFTEQTLPNEAKKAVRLMRANHTVDVYNMSKVRELETTVPGTLKIIHRAEDRFSGNLNERQKNQARRSIETLKKEDTQNLLTELQLVTGMKYMISSNIDVPDGLFNGATGILKFIEVVNNRLQAVYLEMEDKNIGKAARLKRKALMEKNKIQLNWTPIFKVKKSFNVLRKGIVQVTREQYPLIMAEGITVHKSQGLSLPRVTIDLVSSNMEREMKYVALSRATSLNGLYLLGKFVPPDRPKANDPVRVEMERMQNECQLVPKFKKLREIGPHEISIISHNVQSLRKHLGTISSDDTYLSSYIILCQETWANNGMKYEIPGYTEINRNNFSGSVSIAQGTMIFVKTDFINSVVPTRANKFESGKHHVDITSCVLDQSILILNVYRNPGSGVALFKEAINFYLDMITEYDCVLMFGDMNEDLSKDSELERYLISVGLKLLSERKSTTNFGTTLDAVFTKCNLVTEVNIYESYFSYHKPILVKIFMD